MAERFSTGDLVRLKGGHVVMTVRCVIDANAALATSLPLGVRCVWHGSDGTPYEESYWEELVEHARG